MARFSVGRSTHVLAVLAMLKAGCAPQVGVELSFWAGERRVEALSEVAPFSVRVRGVPPGARVRLHTRLAGYHGWGVYRVDDSGQVDTSVSPALDGTYTGVDAFGLVWSMQAEPGSEGLAPTELRAEVELDGARVASGTLTRLPLEQGLRRRELNEGGLVGVLYAPETPEARSAVLVFGGSDGGLAWSSRRAAYLASRGFVALALAYFGTSTLPAALSEIPLEYFQTALDWLSAQPEVAAGRIAVLGASRGGELALELGARFPRVRAVVAEVPSPARWGGISPTGTPVAAWTLGGAALPYVPWASDGWPTPEVLPDGTTGYRLASTFAHSWQVASNDVREAASISVESIAGPVLLLGAGDDGVWPSCTFSSVIIERLEAKGHLAKFGDEGVCLPGAGHLIDLPGAPTTDRYAVPQPGLGFLILGGTPRALADAQREGQRRVETFLLRALGE